MNLIFSSRATPTAAFFEGLVRVFDWWSLFLAVRRKNRRILFERNDPDRSQQIIDQYVRDSISTFEQEEFEKLSEVPFIPRRVSVAADTTLGPLPSDDVIIHYEGIVPGAVDRIMGLASDRLKNDSEAELEYLTKLCRLGYRGMVAGFIITLLLGGSALFLLYTDVLWAGVLLVGINFFLGACSTAYVSRVGLRGKWFTGEFFPRVFNKVDKYGIGGTDNLRRPAI